MDENKIIENKIKEMNKNLNVLVNKESNIPVPDTFQKEEEPIIPTDRKVLPVKSNIIVDPNTGMRQAVTDEDLDESSYDVDLTSESLIDSLGTEEKNIINDNNHKIIKDFGGLTDSETDDLLKVILDYRRDPSSVTNVYDKLPGKFKALIAGQDVALSKAQKNNMAKTLLEELIKQLAIDKGFSDFNESMQKIITDSGFGNALKETSDNTLINNMDLIISKLDPEKDKEKIEKLKSYKEEYKIACSFSRMLEAASKITRVNKDVRKYDWICRDFNYKYKNCKLKLKIQDIRIIGLVLKRHLDKNVYSETDAMMFVCLFYEICKNYSADNIKDHVFMFYTIYTITLLDTTDRESDLYKEIYNHVVEVIDKIHETQLKKIK